ncbi:hypothetical protein HYH02_002919 [Chlamydomonas schloesseri]|uniref:Uncharacterized protein n=1 Tax=Chlamydomonas schloesseri TaxID=2026947 RepID=A0A835WSL3_9CHLO|nr:hypothetical protein HYH02_002919 [Chlamydomonas schloesseri]|eukprot:KAG2452687.1 hypothetical protein HYH02_002919 [Chlamydomonas schloesseri]
MALEQLRQPAFSSLYQQTHGDNRSHDDQYEPHRRQHPQRHDGGEATTAAGTQTLGGSGAGGGAGAPYHATAGGGGGGYSHQGGRNSYSPQQQLHQRHPQHQQQYDITPVGATATGTTGTHGGGGGSAYQSTYGRAPPGSAAPAATAGGGGAAAFSSRRLAARYPRLHTGLLQAVWSGLVWYVSTAAWLVCLPWRATRWLTPRFLQPPLQWAEDTGVWLAAPPARLAGDVVHGTLALADRLITGGTRTVSSVHASNAHHYLTAYEAYLWLFMHRAHAAERHGWEGLRRSLASRTV